MLHLVFCWHFHQPDYRDENGQFVLPWTYLHALKDYSDMAAHLESAPGMRAVVNFVPTLVEQLDDYASQFRTGAVRDALLRWLVAPDLDALDAGERRHLVESCFRVNPATMLEPFPAYRHLRDLWTTASAGGGAMYLSGAYLADLVTWYHLAWTGESLRRDYPLILRLMAQGTGFNLVQRRALFDLAGQVITGLLPRYRALADSGRVELSSTPFSHPMAPLLVDLAAAREARPDLALPQASTYPGGAARVAVHIQAARDSHQRHFGHVPRGYWPAEGGVSEAVLGLLDQAGLAWAASGEGVLRHSLLAKGYDPGPRSHWLSQPYRLDDQRLACFFRDDHLSDLIGFEYKNWHSGDAIRHFLSALETEYAATPSAAPVVTILLDGENAWEHYPYNGWYFLSELYRALVEHPRVRTTTFRDYLAAHPQAGGVLPRLVAGTWVYGDFSTWIGEAAKNRAWDLLCQAKTALDQAWDTGAWSPQTRAAAESCLKACESSDWFWWLGAHNPADSVQSFDRLFRAKLAELYGLMGQPPPAELFIPLSLGGGSPEGGGAMRRGS